MLSLIRRAQGFARPVQNLERNRNWSAQIHRSLAYEAAQREDPTLDPTPSQENPLLAYLGQIFTSTDPQGVKINLANFPNYSHQQMLRFCEEIGMKGRVLRRKQVTYLTIKPNPVTQTESFEEDSRPDKMTKALEQLMPVEISSDMKPKLVHSLNKFDRFMKSTGNKIREAQTQAAHNFNQARYGDQLSRPVARLINAAPPPEMLAARQRLPVAQLKDEVLQLIRDHQAIVISGATGSGKSTQLPQYMLDELGPEQVTRILVVQPRRISATSLARRVSDERGQTLGQQVGYQVRTDKRVSPSTQILFVTTGILLRRFAIDPTLQGFSHIIMDEVHERTLEGDFCLAILKRVMKVRKDLKLVAMSATFKSALFSSYLTLDPALPAKSYDIPGVTYPVEVIPLEAILRETQLRISPEDLNQPPKGTSCLTKTRELCEQVALKYNGFPLNVKSSMVVLDFVFSDKLPPGARLGLAIWEIKVILQVLTHIHRSIKQRKTPPGAVLVFLPGWDDITTVKYAIEQAGALASSCTVLPLHSAISPEEQRRVFDAVPADQTKVVLATNVAETGITISDAVYVIDTGKVKESDFDPDLRIKSLAVKYITQANALQRAGRAGRVAPGYCFRLYPQEFFDAMPSFPIPEVKRTSLDTVILQVLNLSLTQSTTIQGFLDTFIDPPAAEAVEAALRGLRTIGAIETGRECLTPLGRVLASLPLEPRDGKLLVYASMFDLLPAALTLVAARAKDLFVMPPLAERQVAQRAQRHLAVDTNSDPVATINGFHQATGLTGVSFQDFCYKNFISRSNVGFLAQLRHQLTQALQECGFLPVGFTRDVTRYPGIERHDSMSLARLRALLTASLYPNLGKLRIPKSNPPLTTTVDPRRSCGRLAAENNWIVYLGLFVNRNFEAKYLVPCLLLPTIVDSLTLLIFAGGELTIAPPPPKALPRRKAANLKHLLLTTPNQTFRFETDSDSAHLIKRAHDAMEALLSLQLRQATLTQPGVEMRTLAAVRNDLLDTILRSLSKEVNLIRGSMVDASAS
ncbi:hypothetical protein L0F63_000444 [Massospora cicadina]|nr:hypothetical protein L0F63_000444 [Massospora cicadina]